VKVFGAMSRYLEALPEIVRVKVAYAPDLVPKLELTWEEARSCGLVEAVEEAVKTGREKIESLKRFGRRYLNAVPDPVIAQMPRHKVAFLVDLLESRGVNIFQDSVILRVGDSVLTLSIEYECG